MKNNAHEREFRCFEHHKYTFATQNRISQAIDCVKRPKTKF